MCNDRWNNLDHSDHVRIFAGKMKWFGSLKDKACFLWDKYYTIVARYIGCAENSITICYELIVLYVSTKKRDYVRKRTYISVICNSPLTISFAVLTNFDHFQRQIKLYVSIWTNQTIRRNGLCIALAVLRTSCGMYLIRVGTTLLIANNAPPLGFRSSINVVSVLLHC